MPQLSTFHSQLSASPAALPHNPALALWLSVDPLSDKYPGSSPYVYCANNPVMIKDPNGAYGVLVLHQEQSKDIVWRGKVRVQMHLPATATLRMTYYYSTGATAGSLTNEQISYVKDNISSNLNPLVGQSISVKGSSYYFSYNINYVAVQNANGDDLKKKAFNTTYGGYVIGNYIQSGPLDGNDVGMGSQYSMIIDFDKMLAGINNGSCDGQTATHEFFHNVGADDTGVRPGTNIMDYNQRTEKKDEYGIIKGIIPTPRREVSMRDMENAINRPSDSDRIHIINE